MNKELTTTPRYSSRVLWNLHSSDQNKDTDKICIEKGVKYGGRIPKLFIPRFEGIFGKLIRETNGIHIDKERLNHLRFAGDFILIAETAEELREMLFDMRKEDEVGLEIIWTKIFGQSQCIMLRYECNWYLVEQLKLNKSHKNEITDEQLKEGKYLVSINISSKICSS